MLPWKGFFYALMRFDPKQVFDFNISFAWQGI